MESKEVKQNRYKQSQYNFFFDAEDGTYLAFNAMSGGFAKIKNEEYKEIQKMLMEPNKYKVDTVEKKAVWDSLIKGRFLIEPLEVGREFELMQDIAATPCQDGCSLGCIGPGMPPNVE